MHIVGVGLANIDLIAHVDDNFLSKFELIKGQAKKLSSKQFIDLREQLKGIHVEAGGCVGNTLCGIHDKNIKKTVFSKIGNDDYAKIYRDSFKKFNVIYPVQNAKTHSSQCAVLITPDGERTFAYIHGASWLLSPDDIYFETITTATLVYTEIYAMAFGMQTGLWPALVNHIRIKKVPMAMKIVDQEYMDLYRMAIFGLAEEGILALLVGNKDNLCALARRDNIKETLETLSKWKCAVLLTDGAKGAYYIDEKQKYYHGVEPINNPINTSGAGDQYVAGFLEGFLNQYSIENCLKNGETRAKKILMANTPRPNN